MDLQSEWIESQWIRLLPSLVKPPSGGQWDVGLPPPPRWSQVRPCKAGKQGKGTLAILERNHGAAGAARQGCRGMAADGPGGG